MKNLIFIVFSLLLITNLKINAQEEGLLSLYDLMNAKVYKSYNVASSEPKKVYNAPTLIVGSKTFGSNSS